MPPREEILEFATPLPEHEKDFLARLAECYPETIGLWQCGANYRPLQQNLGKGEIDIIMMDNMLETMVHSIAIQTPAGRPFESTLPFQFCANGDEILARNSKYLQRMSPQAAVENWKHLIRFFQAAEPRAEIVFACAPYCLSGSDMHRYRLARDFYLLFKDEAEALGVRLIPPLDVDPEFTKLPDDSGHFETVIYRAMAGHIAMSHLAKLTGIGQPYALPVRVIEA
jgi:hypothetical protein